MGSVAVIGSGISGLGAAYALALDSRFEVTLFESQDYFGGHSLTVDVELDGIQFPVDMGFLVHNDKTYPELVRLFRHLGIERADSEMSFSASLRDQKVEWAGNNFFSLFARKRNSLRPRFWRMLYDISRFHRLKYQLMGDLRLASSNLEELASRFGRGFRDWYLVPMGASIWSSSADAILDYPARSFIKFFENHGLLQVANRPQWKTVRRGSRLYVERMLRPIHHKFLNTPVTSVRKTTTSEGSKNLEVKTKMGRQVFDHVIFATHTNQSLHLLGEEISSEQREILEAIPYQKNVAFLHTDVSFLPTRKTAWASWNYEESQKKANSKPASVTYYINRLQPLPCRIPILVTLNPGRPIEPDKILKQVMFEHPQFNCHSEKAQGKLPLVQGKDNIWFAGAWTRHGFHEDGLSSAVDVLKRMGVALPW